MKKYYFLAMAAIVGLCVSCGSDDSDNSNTDNDGVVEIKAPEKSADAASFRIPVNLISSKAGKLVTDDGQEISASLTGVNITESGKAIFEVTAEYENGSKKLKYVTYDAVLNDNVYTVKDGSKVIGQIERIVATSRASSSVSITVTVTITIPGIGEMTFETDDPVAVTQVVEAISSSVSTVNLSRTWTVERMKLTLVFDDKSKADASRTENSGNLHSFIEVAENNDVNLTEEDKRQLDKVISGITVDKNGLLCLTYSDGVTDAASWSWLLQTNPLKIRIDLKDDEMGNKFLKDDSTIEVQFPGNNKCILILNTRLEEDKCTASLLINLK